MAFVGALALGAQTSHSLSVSSSSFSQLALSPLSLDSACQGGVASARRALRKERLGRASERASEQRVGCVCVFVRPLAALRRAVVAGQRLVHCGAPLSDASCAMACSIASGLCVRVHVRQASAQR